MTKGKPGKKGSVKKGSGTSRNRTKTPKKSTYRSNDLDYLSDEEEDDYDEYYEEDDNDD